MDIGKIFSDENQNILTNRIDEYRILTHPVKSICIQYIHHNPGCTVTQIYEHVRSKWMHSQMSDSGINQQLTPMYKKKIIRQEKEGKYRKCFLQYSYFEEIIKSL